MFNAHYYYYEMKLKQHLLLLLLASIWTLTSFAQTNYFVDKVNGSDSNNGISSATPFQTIEEAVNNVNPGDTILIMGIYTNDSYNPNYSYSGNINDSHIWHQENTIRINGLNGSASNYITIKAFDSNTILKGDGANIFRVQNSSYLRIEGLELSGEVENILLSTAKAIQFLYRESGSTNTLHRVPPGTTDEQVEQNYSSSGSLPALSDVSRPSYTDTRGFYFSDVHHIDFIDNKVHHTPGNGFRVAKCDYINIIGNEVHNTSRKSYSGTHGLVVTNANSSIQGSLDTNSGYRINILKNKVHHNYNEIYSWAPTKTLITPRIDEGKGISLQRNDLANGWSHGRFLIANNLTYWNGYSGLHSNTGLRMDFINNTAYMNSYTNSVTYLNGTQGGNNIGMSTSGDLSDDIKFINNIIYIDNAWGGFPVSVATTTNVVVSDNLIYGINGIVNLDNDVTHINNTLSDPLFVDAEDHQASSYDFGLQASSPAIGIANILYSPTDDFFGFTRDANPDLGALENNPPTTAQNMVVNMGRGINLGNVLSAPVEGNWAPEVEQQYFIDVATVGFTCVRIPMDFFGTRTSGDTTIYSSSAGTSGSYTGSIADFTVSTTYLNRIEQVIDWATGQGLVAIIDIHGSDLKSEFLNTFDIGNVEYTDPTSAKRLADLDKFKAIWTAIANRFINKSDNVLFEVINEPYFEVSEADMNALNTSIINVIRATGGNNTTRNILITGGTKTSYEAPTTIDPAIISADDYLIATFHYYKPFNFTSSTKDNNDQDSWGNTVDKAAVDAAFDAVLLWSNTNNIPVFLGEFGADNTGGYNYDTGDLNIIATNATGFADGGPDNASRVEYHRYIAEQAINRGFAFAAWDAGPESNKTIHKRNDAASTVNYDINNFSVTIYNPKLTTPSTVIDNSIWVEDVKDALFNSGTWPVPYIKSDVNGFWNVGTTWLGGIVPTATDDVQIDHTVTIKSDETVANIAVNNETGETGYLKINNGWSLKVTGDLTITGTETNGVLLASATNRGSSIIVEGTASGIGKYRRRTAIASSNGGTNDLISAPLAGDTFSSVVNSSSLYQNGTTGNYLFGPFNNAGNPGVYEVYSSTTNASTVIESGKGYRAGTDAGANVVFTGTIRTDQVDISITDEIGNYGSWNLIGNPYPSYLSFKDFFDLVSDVTGTVAGSNNKLDPAYTAVYGYDADDTDPTGSIWTIWDFNNTTYASDLIIPGQGFFVKAKAGAGAVLNDNQVTFTPSMRIIGTSDDFISGRMADTNLALAKLNLTNANNSYTTNIYFRDINTRGLDPGYDTGAYDQASLGIYTHLVEDNTGVQLANQSLPYNDLNDVVVPLSVNADQDVQISIGLDTASIVPSTTHVYLEDNVTNIWTLLNSDDYLFTPSVSLSGIGRFFVHFSATTLSVSDDEIYGLQIYTASSSKELFIKGQLSRKAIANLYDIQGRLILIRELNQFSNKNKIDISSISTGIYVVKVDNGDHIKTQKIIIK